jgi:hypothetical protein
MQIKIRYSGRSEGECIWLVFSYCSIKILTSRKFQIKQRPVSKYDCHVGYCLCFWGFSHTTFWEMNLFLPLPWLSVALCNSDEQKSLHLMLWTNVVSETSFLKGLKKRKIYKLSLCRPLRHIGGSEVWLHSFLSWTICGGDCKRHAPAVLPLEENPGTRWIVDSVGPRFGEDDLEKRKMSSFGGVRTSRCLLQQCVVCKMNHF